MCLTSSLRIALTGELLSVLDQAVQLPVGIDLEAAPKREAVEPLVVPDIGEHRLDDGEAPAFVAAVAGHAVAAVSADLIAGRADASLARRVGVEVLRGRDLLRGTVEKFEVTEYGQKFAVHGQLKGPTGRVASVVAVWIILAGESAPRFVTAYPEE